MNVPTYSQSGTKLQARLRLYYDLVFWQRDLLNVNEFIGECMDVMLGADSD